MKRLVVLLVLVVIALAPLFADGINLGDFPLGSWTDGNYQAVWEFSTGNIRILATDGTVYYDFSTAGVQDFKVGVGSDGPYITFTCAAAGKSYKLTKPLLKSEMLLQIDRSGLPTYEVTMPKK